MGSSFSNAFKRELGKNTAKTVSNIVFGDKWSTPYRRVNSEREQRLREKQQAEIETMEERTRIEHQNQLNLLDSAVLGNIDKLVSIQIPNDVDGLNSYLGKLSVQMRSVRYEKDGEEAEIRNKYLVALIECYKQGVEELLVLNPSDRRLSNYVNLLLDRDYEIKINEKKKKVIIILIIAIIVLSLSALSIMEGYIGYGILGILAGLLLVILWQLPIIKVKRNKNKEKKKYEQLMTCGTQNQSQIQAIKPQPAQEFEILHKESDFSNVFFDLNENNRIGNSLARIWSKYKGAVSDEILSRRPIFAADGVKDCILYVGVNPSYSAEDDQLFIENEDSKSLLYGSFYKRDDAPQYFKELESFAGRFGKSYAHMNLLYVRENDRDMVMTMNSEFIREQLELTYDTIIKLQPKLIVFFTTYCKNLIFGADRWVNPKSLDRGHYILNGTNIPVVFSEDIAMMDNGMRDKIFETVKMAF